jgi:hypothetical protein
MTMTSWIQIGKFLGGGVAAILALIGLKVAAEYGAGSHYQGGVVLFVVASGILFWQITSARFGQAAANDAAAAEASELILYRALTRSVPDEMLK